MVKGKWQRASSWGNLPGFTLIEFIVVMVIFTSLLMLATIALTTVKQKASLSTSTDILIADMRQQQIKAMVGETEGRAANDSYGIHFGVSSYTLFHGSVYYATDSANLSIALGDNINIVAAPTDIVFSKLSGDVQGGATSVTLRDLVTSLQKTLTINRYGVVSGVN